MILLEIMLDVVMGVMDMEVDKVANMMVDMEVDNVADEVADVEIDMVVRITKILLLWLVDLLTKDSGGSDGQRKKL